MRGDDDSMPFVCIFSVYVYVIMCELISIYIAAVTCLGMGEGGCL